MSFLYPLIYVVLFALYWVRHVKSYPPLTVIPLPPGPDNPPKNAATSNFATLKPTLAPPPAPSIDPNDFKSFPLLSRQNLSHNVSIFRFGLLRPTDFLGVPPGQHIALAFDEAGKKVSRSYTPISTDEHRGYFDVLVKLYPLGKMSNFLQKMKTGDNIWVRGPKGAMVYRAGPCDRIGMIAGGSGITPMLQIITAVHANRPHRGGDDTTRLDLIYANKKEEDIILRDEIDRIVMNDEGINVYYVLSEPPGEWEGGSGRITMDMIKARFAPPADRHKVMLCGPPGLLSSTTELLASWGYEKARPISKRGDQVFCF